MNWADMFFFQTWVFGVLSFIALASLIEDNKGWPYAVGLLICTLITGSLAAGLS